jgi:predicted AAA+ superfamily ATPase
MFVKEITESLVVERAAVVPLRATNTRRTLVPKATMSNVQRYTTTAKDAHLEHKVSTPHSFMKSVEYGAVLLR